MASLPPAPEGFPATVVVEVKVQRSGGVHSYTVTEVAFLNHPRGLIRKGDLILEVNGVPLQHVTPSELGLAVRSSTILTMDIHREESDQSPRSPRPRSPRRPPVSQGGGPPVVPFPAVDLSRGAVMHCSGWETKCLPLQLGLTERREEKDAAIGDDAQPSNGKCVEPGHATVEGLDEGDSERGWEEALEEALARHGEGSLALIFRRPDFMVMKMRGPEEVCGSCGRFDCSTEHVQARSTALSFASSRNGNLSSLVLRLLREEPRVRLLDERDSVVTRAADGSVRVAPCRNPVPDAFCMTIFRFKSTVPVDAGEPVVLGFYNSNCYLACQEGTTNLVKLIVETHSRDEFRNITKSSGLFHLIFYRKEFPDGTMRFESAQFPSWFVYSGERQLVQMHNRLNTSYSLLS
ncbi:uncharacterized protein LOC116954430 [Petromyzon marinus]|uniref:Uncharacterized protein LOC116954430 n=1 Tax=Petromyzon marinus TaxID=7757 RepID=A0AAJ7U6V7_PETMA|nr:uncharacterized protein LOC116954430 [Petromyzon marinus]